jgi:hypothetical protein
MIMQAGAATAEKYPKADDMAVVIPIYRGSPPIFSVMGPKTATVALELMILEKSVVKKILRMYGIIVNCVIKEEN